MGRKVFTGADDELIASLCEGIDQLAQRGEEAQVALARVLFNLGVPVEPPTPGDDTAIQTAAAIRHRLTIMYADGQTEASLVRLVRDVVTASVEIDGDVAEHNRNRAGIRNALLELYADPDVFRAYFNRSVPGSPLASWSDQQIREEGFRVTGASQFDDVDADQVVSAWAVQSVWTEITADQLSDASITAWEHLNTARRTGT